MEHYGETNGEIFRQVSIGFMCFVRMNRQLCKQM